MMKRDDSALNPDQLPHEIDKNPGPLRPTNLTDFIGQNHIRHNLRVFIEAAKERGEALDHVLFFGPPGLGKTTLAFIVAQEMGVNFKATSGPIITKPGDLAALLTNLEKGDILFIDEIHRLSPQVEEVLYSAMEDFTLDLLIGEGPAARSVRLDLPHFTLVGATTRSGLITRPLRERFGIPFRLEFYTPEELSSIIDRQATLLDVSLVKEGSREIAKRCRGTPRIAGRLLRRVRDFSALLEDSLIDGKRASQSLEKLAVDSLGLDAMDRHYLSIIATFYNGGPVGIDTLCAALSEQKDVIEDVIEPYLLQEGFIQRTARGRLLTDKTYGHLGIVPPIRAGLPLD